VLSEKEKSGEVIVELFRNFYLFLCNLKIQFNVTGSVDIGTFTLIG